ncbi:histidine phosphatase family protein [Undibacterium sp. SXout11W]|uniref:histidine phosphatase family protein n=1 Tax=Undibacterium sp. SXout11W TaxID=3413050 RepID=UPI003BF08E88
MAQLYLIRHGQASFGSQNYDQLSELGTQQSRQLGKWWAERDFAVHRIVTGALHRHQQTALACMSTFLDCEEDKLNTTGWHTDAGFNEYHHHEVLVKHVPEFEDPAVVKHFLKSKPDAGREFQDIFSAAIARWMSGQFDTDYTETWHAFQNRCIAAFQKQLTLNDGAKNIAVFTSGGTISAICQHLLNLPDGKFSELNWTLVNSGVTRIHVQPERDEQASRLALAYLNNFSHLELLNDPKCITYV